MRAQNAQVLELDQSAQQQMQVVWMCETRQSVRGG